MSRWSTRRIISDKKVIDRETGEILHEEHITERKCESEPDFIKLYIDDLGTLMGLTPAEMGLALNMAKNMTYADDELGSCVFMTGLLKKKICETVGIKNNTVINRLLLQLKNKGIIYRVDRSVYRMNPYFFGRGTWKDIEKIRMIVEYEKMHPQQIKMRVEFEKRYGGSIPAYDNKESFLEWYMAVPERYRDCIEIPEKEKEAIVQALKQEEQRKEKPEADAPKPEE